MKKKQSVTIVEKGAGAIVSVVGDTYRMAITGKQTNGDFALIDMLVPPGGGPGPHAHPAFHETFYVQQGEVQINSEEGTYIAKEGTVIHIPKGGMVHSFKNNTDKLTRLLCIVVPAGLEEFFMEFGKPVAANTFLPPAMDEQTIKTLEALAAKYGMQTFPPDYLDKK